MQRCHDGCGIQPHGRQVKHALARIQNGAVARAATQIARQFISQLLTRRLRALLLVMLVGRPQRHHNAGRAKAALRAMAVHHGLLHGVQILSRRLASTGALACPLGRALAFEIFHREQRLAMQAWQKLDAGVDGLQLQAVDRLGITRLSQLANHHSAGAAVPFVAAFLGACAVRIFAQPLQHGAGGMRALHLDHLASMEKAYGLCVLVMAHDRGTKREEMPACKMYSTRSICQSGKTTRATTASHMTVLIAAM